MFGQPRCREWTPLATQQLRLRSLIQIVGYNIRPPEGLDLSPGHSLYYTLHVTTMSAPFYTSERLSSPNPKWREIDSEVVQKMSSTNVVIRIWCHIDSESSKEASPALRIENVHSRDVSPIRDIVIETWGVYFSGLLHIGANLTLNFTSDSFKSNTLVLQMHGGYFCSYQSLRLVAVPSDATNEAETLSSSESSSGSKWIPIEMRLMNCHRYPKESKSVSPRDNFSWRRETDVFSKSQSPPNSSFKQNFSMLRSSSSLNIKQRGNVEYRRETSRSNDDRYYVFSRGLVDLEIGEDCDGNCESAAKVSEDGSKEDWRNSAEQLNESEPISKCRYSALNFLDSEIRPSYNSEKLQRLHLLQFSIKKRKEAVQEIKDRIHQKYALELLHETSAKLSPTKKTKSGTDKSEDSKKNSSGWNGSVEPPKRPAFNHFAPNDRRFTLSLSKLLEDRSRPSPLQRSEHARLVRMLERARLQRRLLTGERDRKMATARLLRAAHSALYEENQDYGTELMQKYHWLSRCAETLRARRQSCAALRELSARSAAALAVRRRQLLAQMQQIFCIEKMRDDSYTICGCGLTVCDDIMPPHSLRGGHEAVGAGLAAQATQLAARLLATPTRYAIRARGSETTIVDHLTPNLVDRDIPLYARNRDVTLFRYGLFLLNKCIAQLLWASGVAVTDVRPTLRNLQRLVCLPPPCAAARNTVLDASKLFGSGSSMEGLGGPADPLASPGGGHSLRTLVAGSERGANNQGRQFNRFKDGMGGHACSDGFLQRKRPSRSFGSYCTHLELQLSPQNLETSHASILGSEPTLLHTLCINTQAINATTSQPRIANYPLKSCSSESELSKLTGEQNQDTLDSQNLAKVVFTLGGYERIDATPFSNLVKISTNNEDEIETTGEESLFIDREPFKDICGEISAFCVANGSNMSMYGECVSREDVLYGTDSLAADSCTDLSKDVAVSSS